MNAHDERHGIQSVARAMAIIEQLAGHGSGLTVSQLTRSIGVHKSTVSRLLATLEQADVVVQDEQLGSFQLSLGIVALAGSVLGRYEILRVANPELRRLAETTGQTINLTVRHRDLAMNIQQIPGVNVERRLDWVGETVPLHLGAGSKVLLAHLNDGEIDAYLAARSATIEERGRIQLLQEIDEIRRTGRAVNRGEIDPDIYAVGAPILNADGACAASVSVAGTASDFEDPDIAVIAGQVMAAAKTISRQLGYPVGRFAPFA